MGECQHINLNNYDYTSNGQHESGVYYLPGGGVAVGKSTDLGLGEPSSKESGRHRNGGVCRKQCVYL